MLWRMRNLPSSRTVPAGAPVGRVAPVCDRELFTREDELSYCERRIAEEERLAGSAGSWEADLVHDQTAMLYRAQLATLRRLQDDPSPRTTP